MLRFLKGFFAKPKHPDTLPPTAPYKVEASSTNWPFPQATEIAPEPTPVVATAPAKKPRAPAKPKATPAVKSAVAAKKPRAQKIPAK
jgi:hypothetical protein